LRADSAAAHREAGYKRNFVIYDESDQISAIKKILVRISAKGEKTDPAAILALLSKFRNGGERATAFADESVRAMAEHIRGATNQPCALATPWILTI